MNRRMGITGRAAAAVLIVVIAIAAAAAFYVYSATTTTTTGGNSSSSSIATTTTTGLTTTATGASTSTTSPASTSSGSTNIVSTSATTTTAATAQNASTSLAHPVSIKFYESLAPSEAAFVQGTIIPEFQQQNPGVTVQLVNLPSADSVASNIEALVKGNNAGTSLVGIDNLVVGELVYGNYTTDLSQYTNQIIPSGMIQSAVNMVNYEKQIYNNHVYFIPYRSNVPLVFYDKNAFQKAGISTPPSTAAQLMTDAQALKNAGYSNPIMFQGGDVASTATELYQWSVQFGGNPFLLNDTGTLATFQYLWNLSSTFSPDYTHGYWGSYSGLAQGTYQVLDYQWPYIYNILTNATYKMTNQTLGVYPGPSGPANGNHILGGDVLVIPKGTQNIPQVTAFANFLLGAQAQHQTLVSLSWVAVNSQAYDNLPSNMSAIGQVLLSAINQGVFLRNPTPWITQWNNVAYDAWQKIVVDHAPYSQIQSILNSENQQMYQFLVSNYGQAVANQYEQNAFKPISVGG
jgi:trehalose transport system substrate-binding protein